MRKLVRLTKAIVIFAVTFYVSTTAVVYFVQDSLIFPAPDSVIVPSSDRHFKHVTIPTSDGELLFALHHPSEKGEATILVFHGNADAAIRQTTKGRALAEEGFGVLLVEYRGYPGSTGTPSETGLYADGRAAYDFVFRQREQLIGLYAHSLGTGVAVKLATERDVFSVVLESPFDSLMAVAQRRFPWMPVSLLLNHKFQSDKLIQQVKAPILIMHGEEDKVIPLEHGKRLHQRALSGVKFLAIENAGHNNLSEFSTHREAIKFFKQTLN